MSSVDASHPAAPAVDRLRTGERQAPSARRLSHDTVLRRLLGVGDAVAVAIALGLALALSGISPRPHDVLWGVLAVPTLIVLFKLYGLYDRDVKRISHSTVDDLPWLLHAILVGSLLVWLYFRDPPLGRFDFAQVVVFGVATAVLVLTIRSGVRHGFAKLAGPEQVLLVGTDAMADVLVAKLAAHPEYRQRVIGALVGASPATAQSAHGLPVLGTLEELELVVAEHRVTRLLLSPGDIDDQELEELLRRCRAGSIKVSVLPQLSDVLGPAVEIDDVEGVAVLGINPPWLPRSSRAVKRALDIASAAGLLVLTSPLMALVAILIKLDSRGPVFFGQERVGKGGARFRLFKFCTMVAEAEMARTTLLEHSTDPNWLMLDYDPRITRIGRHLRRLSIDELPQLWNVLRGQMSMVGPRPLIPSEDERIQGWGRGRLDLTPGLTGYWQVLGRTRIPFEEMVKLDYLYVTNWSLWEDVRLILRTLPIVLSGRGAN